MVVNLIVLIVAMLLDLIVVFRIHFVIKKQLRFRSSRRFVLDRERSLTGEGGRKI